jgi:hypothetical protein
MMDANAILAVNVAYGTRDQLRENFLLLVVTGRQLEEAQGAARNEASKE